MVAPCGSAMPWRRRTSTSTEKLLRAMAMLRHRTSRTTGGRRPARRRRCSGREVADTISSGSAGGGGCLSQGWASSQSRRRLLVERRAGWSPGAQSSAGQNRDESGVSTSSQMDSAPSMKPSSNLVSQMTMPCASARAAARGVGGQAQGRRGLGRLLAHEVDGLVHPDVEVVALGGLGRGGEDGLGQPVGVAEPGGHGHPVDRALLLGTPCRPSRPGSRARCTRCRASRPGGRASTGRPGGRARRGGRRPRRGSRRGRH